ncbi:hypothetical protein [Bradyrhizobium sp. 143]|uniref:hypothetical protein n=1 Tax=unclassified Bradyrhizobium TaxID=2631580 RepID=UPI0032093186
MNPIAYIAETLEVIIAGHPQSKIEDLIAVAIPQKVKLASIGSRLTYNRPYRPAPVTRSSASLRKRGRRRPSVGSQRRHLQLPTYDALPDAVVNTACGHQDRPLSSDETMYLRNFTSGAGYILAHADTSERSDETSSMIKTRRSATDRPGPFPRTGRHQFNREQRSPPRHAASFASFEPN